MGQVARRQPQAESAGHSSDVADEGGVAWLGRVRRGPRTRDDGAQRLRAALAHHGIVEKQILRGVAFMIDERMVASTSRLALLLRVGKEGQAAALHDPCICLAEMPNGRPMSEYVKIDHAGLSDAELARWVDMAVAHVRALAAAHKP
jgi:hypothetical protein